jgi:hypothetical protein
MKLASRLHSGSLARCQRETGARQFVKWLRFFQEEDVKEIERTEKWEHYAARIAARILQAAGVKDAKESDEVIKFQVSHPKTKEEPVTKEQRVKESKAFWSMFFAVHKGVKESVKRVNDGH